MIKRPFYAGKELPAEEYFFDRKKELTRLKIALLSKEPINIALVGERRSGKTTLIKKIAKDIEKKQSILIKCEKLLPLDAKTFLQNLIRELVSRYFGKGGLLKERVKNLTKKLSIGLTIEDINFWIEFGERGVSLKELMDRAFKIIASLNEVKPTIIFLDEFHELFKFGNEFIWALRAYISDSKASFVVSSSWHRFMEKLQDKEHPFFNFFEIVELKEVDENDARAYLTKRIKIASMSFTPEVLNILIKDSQLRPYYIQLLALKCFENALIEGKKTIDFELYKRAFRDALSNIPNYLLADYRRLRGKTKEIFVSMCLYDFRKPAEIATKLSMDPSNVIQILSQIIKNYSIIKKINSEYEVKDNFLKEFVKADLAS